MTITELAILKDHAYETYKLKKTLRDFGDWSPATHKMYDDEVKHWHGIWASISVELDDLCVRYVTEAK